MRDLYVLLPRLQGCGQLWCGGIDAKGGGGPEQKLVLLALRVSVLGRLSPGSPNPSTGASMAAARTVRRKHAFGGLRHVGIPVLAFGVIAGRMVDAFSCEFVTPNVG